jgi:hypothetical protein
MYTANDLTTGSKNVLTRVVYNTVGINIGVLVVIHPFPLMMKMPQTQTQTQFQMTTVDPAMKTTRAMRRPHLWPRRTGTAARMRGHRRTVLVVSPESSCAVGGAPSTSPPRTGRPAASCRPARETTVLELAPGGG